MNSNVFAHPSMCTTPELIWALQDRLGMIAIVEGRRVRLEPKPTGRPHNGGKHGPSIER